MLTVVARLVRDALVAKESGTVAGEYNHTRVSHNLINLWLIFIENVR